MITVTPQLTERAVDALTAVDQHAAFFDWYVSEPDAEIRRGLARLIAAHDAVAQVATYEATPPASGRAIDSAVQPDGTLHVQYDPCMFDQAGAEYVLRTVGHRLIRADDLADGRT